jgi:hypothetical protein
MDENFCKEAAAGEGTSRAHGEQRQILHIQHLFLARRLPGLERLFAPHGINFIWIGSSPSRSIEKKRNRSPPQSRISRSRNYSTSFRYPFPGTPRQRTFHEDIDCHWPGIDLLQLWTGSTSPELVFNGTRVRGKMLEGILGQKARAV